MVVIFDYKSILFESQSWQVNHGLTDAKYMLEGWCVLIIVLTFVLTFVKTKKACGQPL